MYARPAPEAAAAASAAEAAGGRALACAWEACAHFRGALGQLQRALRSSSLDALLPAHSEALGSHVHRLASDVAALSSRLAEIAALPAVCAVPLPPPANLVVVAAGAARFSGQPSLAVFAAESLAAVGSHLPDTAEMRMWLDQLEVVNGTIRAIDDLIAAGNFGVADSLLPCADRSLCPADQLAVVVAEPAAGVAPTPCTVPGHMAIVAVEPATALAPTQCTVPGHMALVAAEPAAWLALTPCTLPGRPSLFLQSYSGAERVASRVGHADDTSHIASLLCSPEAPPPPRVGLCRIGVPPTDALVLAGHAVVIGTDSDWCAEGFYQSRRVDDKAREPVVVSARAAVLPAASASASFHSAATWAGPITASVSTAPAATVTGPAASAAISLCNSGSAALVSAASSATAMVLAAPAVASCSCPAAASTVPPQSPTTAPLQPMCRPTQTTQTTRRGSSCPPRKRLRALGPRGGRRPFPESDAIENFSQTQAGSQCKAKDDSQGITKEGATSSAPPIANSERGAAVGKAEFQVKGREVAQTTARVGAAVCAPISNRGRSELGGSGNVSAVGGGQSGVLDGRCIPEKASLVVVGSVSPSRVGAGETWKIPAAAVNPVRQPDGISSNGVEVTQRGKKRPIPGIGADGGGVRSSARLTARSKPVPRDIVDAPVPAAGEAGSSSAQRRRQASAQNRASSPPLAPDAGVLVAPLTMPPPQRQRHASAQHRAPTSPPAPEVGALVAPLAAPPPQRALNKGRLQVLFTGFARGDLHRMNRCVQCLGGTAVKELPLDAAAAAAVRVVVRGDAASPCTTMKYYDALMSGAWVLRSEWVIESKKAGFWQPEADFVLAREPTSMSAATSSGAVAFRKGGQKQDRDQVASATIEPPRPHSAIFAGLRLHFPTAAAVALTTKSTLVSRAASEAFLNDVGGGVRGGRSMSCARSVSCLALMDEGLAAGPRPADLTRLALRGGAEVLDAICAARDSHGEPPSLSSAARAAAASPWWRRPIAVVTVDSEVGAAAAARAAGWHVVPARWFLDCICACEIVAPPERCLTQSSLAVVRVEAGAKGLAISSTCSWFNMQPIDVL